MEIRPATPQDNRAIAELALMAGEVSQPISGHSRNKQVTISLMSVQETFCQRRITSLTETSMWWYWIIRLPG